MSSNSLAIVPQYQDPQMLETIKETVCRGATPAQFKMFIEVCKATGLNPFLKEIWFVPSVGVMAGRDGYLRVANASPQFDGMETRVERTEQGVPIKAVCTVWRKDRTHPVICEAYYNEYKKGGNVWNTYPSAMIAKVAEVLALKRSFAINGVVTEEEVGEQGSKEAQQEYLRSKGIEPTIPEKHRSHQPPPDIRTASEQHKALIVETAKMLDEPPQTYAQAMHDSPAPSTKTIEMRHAATVAEADAQLKEVAKPKKAAPKLTADSIEIRKGMTNMKDMLRAVTGDDTIYYDVLKSHGYASSAEIPTREIGRRIYLKMGEIHTRLVDEKKLRAELELVEHMYHDQFYNIMGNHGCEVIEDALALTSEPLEALRVDLKRLGGAA